MKKQKGFTLIELLVVIAIIGMLSTLAVVSLNSAREKSRDAKRIADVRQIQTALELYYQDNNGYPAGANAILGTGIYTCLVTDTGFVTSTDAACARPYMGLIPGAPQPADGSCDLVSNAYTYNQVDSGKDYTIGFCLGGVTGSLPGGPKTATSAGVK